MREREFETVAIEATSKAELDAKVAAETEHRLVQKCSSHEVSEAGVQVHKATIVRSTKHHLTEG